MSSYVMAKANQNDTDARISFRVDPEYRDALQRLAIELGKNQSLVVREALEQYIERNQKYLSPVLFRFFRLWRQDRKRYNLLG